MSATTPRTKGSLSHWTNSSSNLGSLPSDFLLASRLMFCHRMKGIAKLSTRGQTNNDDPFGADVQQVRPRCNKTACYLHYMPGPGHLLPSSHGQHDTTQNGHQTLGNSGFMGRSAPRRSGLHTFILIHTASVFSSILFSTGSLGVSQHTDPPKFLVIVTHGNKNSPQIGDELAHTAGAAECSACATHAPVLPPQT